MRRALWRLPRYTFGSVALAVMTLLALATRAWAIPPPDYPTWYVYSGISCAGITSPTAGSTYCSDQQITCTIAEATDVDQKYTPGSGYTYENDTLSYTWTCSEGSFPSGASGRTVVWSPPGVPEHPTQTLTCTVQDTAYIPSGETGNRNDTDLVLTVNINVYAYVTNRGLPTTNLNNVSNRSNIRWANTDSSIGCCDQFQDLGGVDWTVDRVRMWVVPAVPADSDYFLGDQFTSVTLYGGAAGSPLTQLASGSFVASTNGFTGISPAGVTITATKTSYSGVNYEDASGVECQIWEIEFGNLNWSTGTGAYLVGMTAAPKYDRLWFVHAQADTPGGFYQFTSGAAPTAADGEGWFGKGSRLNMQVLGHGGPLP